MNDGLTSIQAEDLIYASFLNVLRNHAESIIGYIPFVKWPGQEPIYEEGSEAVEQDGKINSDLHWLRIQIQPIESKRLGHLKNAYNESGLLSIEWFSPKSKAEAYREMQLLNQLIRNAFVDKRLYKSLRFKSGITTPLDPDKSSYRLKTTIEYKYIEIVEELYIAIRDIQDATGSLFTPWGNDLQNLANNKF